MVISNEYEDLKTQFLIYISHWKLFVATAIFFLAGTYLYIKIKNPVYFTETKIQIIDKENNLQLPSALFLKSPNVNIENNIEIIQSKRLLKKVIRTLNLTTQFYKNSGTRTIELWNPSISIKCLTYNTNKDPFTFTIQVLKGQYLISYQGEEVILPANQTSFSINGQRFKIQKNNNANPKISDDILSIKVTPLTTTIAQLEQKISVKAIGENSDILAISIKDENIAKSKAILDNLVYEFNEDGILDKKIVLEKTIDFINDRLRYLTNELDIVENHKKEFKEWNFLSYLESDAYQYVQQKGQSENLVFTAETQIQLSKLLEDITSKQKGDDIIPENIGVTNEVLTNLIIEYNKTILQRNKMLLSAGDANPVIISINTQLGTLKTDILKSIQTYLKQLQIQLAQHKENDSKQRIKIQNVPNNEKILREIERQQKIKEDLFMLLLQKREEASVSAAAISPSVKIIDYAENNPNPIEPNKKIYFLSALALSLLLPTLSIKSMQLFDTKIKTANDPILNDEEIPLIGSIPKFESTDNLIEKNDRSLSSELFRILTTNINFLLQKRDNKQAAIIMITSSIMGEGKTFTAKNVASAFASYNKKVLLIGADLRKPRLKDELNISYDGKGLSSYLNSATTTIEDIIRKNQTPLDGLDIILAGFIPPNPSNLLSNGKFEELINLLKKEYEYIIVDCAPTVYVNDTFLINKLADLTVYMIRAKYTEKDLVHYSNKLAKEQKVKNMAYLFNHADKINGIKYETYYYGHESSDNK